MVGNSRDDDDPVVVVGEGLVVAAAEGRVTADGRRRRDAAASAGVDQGFHLGRILWKAMLGWLIHFKPLKDQYWVHY